MKINQMKESDLSREPDTEPNEGAVESRPPPGRWDPVPDSTGHKKPLAPSENEDDEGRSQSVN